MPKGAARKPEGPPTILNRRARYDYELLNSYEAGIALQGSEVKSVLRGQVNMTSSYCHISGGELFIEELDIAPYDKSSVFTPERRRSRKLLMHKREIELIRRRSEERGLTIVPTKVYFRNGRVKVEIAIARGKRQYDKRDKLDAKHARREAQSD